MKLFYFLLKKTCFRVSVENREKLENLNIFFTLECKKIFASMDDGNISVFT